MNRISIATLACLALAAGCSSKSSQQTDTPDAGAVAETPTTDGDAGAADADAPAGERPKARMGSGTRSTTKRTGKHRSLVAKKPPVAAGGKTKAKRTAKARNPSDPVVVSGVVPTMLVSGGVFQVFGEGFDEDPAKNKVTINGKAQTVLEVADDHLVVQAGATPTTGAVRVRKGGGRMRSRGKSGSGTPTTANKVTVLGAGDGFATPATLPGQGLLGAVYDIGGASTEMPDFNSVGDPVGYVLMGNLDIATGGFSGFPVGGAELNENFGIHFQGSLNVVEGGDYELCLAAGDGAILFLNGAPFLDNDGAGETREVCDTVEIEPGEFDLQLLYFQNEGDLSLQLTWAKDGGAKEAIPASAFFPPENLDGLAQALNQ